jgi:hypothetical protein
MSGWAALVGLIAAAALCLWQMAENIKGENVGLTFAWAIGVAFFLLMLIGLFMVNPNEARCCSCSGGTSGRACRALRSLLAWSLCFDAFLPDDVGPRRQLPLDDACHHVSGRAHRLRAYVDELLTDARVLHRPHEGVAQIMEKIIRECIAVGRAEGASLDDALVQTILSGYRSSPDSVNSIHADRLAGRQMEIDARNGAVWLHTLSGQTADGAWQNLCDAGPDGRRQGFPIAGRPRPDGMLEEAEPGVFELVCTSAWTTFGDQIIAIPVAV